MVAFDKDRGMEVAIRAMGGRYLPLKSGEPAGFNPFQCEPTPAGLLFLKQFVKRLASAGGDPVTHNDEVEIDQALKTLMVHRPAASPPVGATSGAAQPDPRRTGCPPSVHARLMKWCQGATTDGCSTTSTMCLT